MDKQELQALLSAEENIEVVAELLPELGWESPEAVKGLKDKNRELLSKQQQLKNKISFYTELVGEEVDDEKLEAIKAAAADPKTVKAGDDVAKLSRELEQTRKRLSVVETEASTYKSKHTKSVAETALLQALTRSGVDSTHFSILKDAMLGKVRVEEVDGSESVVFDDGRYGVDVGDYIKNWAETDGRVYLKASQSQGAGVRNPGQSQPQSSTYKRVDLQNPGVRAEYTKRLKNGENVSIVE